MRWRMSLSCLFRFSSSVCRDANCDCNSPEACLPSAVVTMAFRTLMTPTLPVAAEPAAAPCALAAAVLKRQAAARATVEITFLEFTFVSLLRPSASPCVLHRHVLLGWANQNWLEICSATPACPAGLAQT